MAEKNFEPRKPDFKGFAVGKDNKADFTISTGAVWFHDGDTKPTKPFTYASNDSKVRFFPTAQLEQWQRENEEAEQRKKAKQTQSTTTPIE